MFRADSQIFFKIPKKLKQEFLQITTEKNISASHVLREFIKKYIENAEKIKSGGNHNG